MSEQKAFIFDLDGTLADTIPVCVKAFQNTFRIHGGPDLDAQGVRALFGPTEEGIFAEMFPAKHQEVLETFLSEYRKAHVLCAKPFEGIVSILASLQAHGHRLAIVTGKGPQSAAISCEWLGLGDYFADVRAGSPMGLIKAEAMRSLLTQWSISPQKTFYIGDMPCDIEASQEVGVWAISAAWSPSADAELLKTYSPNMIFTDVAAFGQWISIVAI
jgi:phosphoglycolate phosphatase/pyrophosphatase PpaX